jgi:hypothetical protein
LARTRQQSTNSLKKQTYLSIARHMAVMRRAPCETGNRNIKVAGETKTMRQSRDGY